ncbi:MAG: 16S rRNA (uracil(1498)-N(3))-methyltransferase [Deltaproteobacteria bacterium]
MRRFFSEDITAGAESVRISGDEFTHLKRVLRLKQGDDLAVFDGKGLEVQGRITAMEAGCAIVSVEGTAYGRLESPRAIRLLQGLLKSDKPEFVIQKATELGAATITFFTTSRTIPISNGSKTKWTRWRKAAIEAAKQCGRTRLPELTPVAAFKDAVMGCTEGIRLILWEGTGKTISIKEALKNADLDSAIVVAVGPEGGFSVEDVAAAEKAGFVAVSIGPRILRAETAALAAIAIIQYETGDLREPIG